ncbi:MAG: Gfo/Idh/MocA family oxidoreductase [Thermomicrobiales bacterium]
MQMGHGTIGLGVIGCGDVAMRTYAPGLVPLADRATVSAVYDPDPARAAAFAADLAQRGLPRPRVHATLGDLLADDTVTGVLNLSPAPYHQEITMAAFAAGRSVFSEKPLANTLAEARTAIDTARAAHLTYLVAPAVMTTNRWRWLKHQLSAGWLGPLTLAVGQMANMGPAAWRDYKGDPAVFYSAAVGPALDTGVYILHAITGILGPARRVEAFGGVSIPRRTVLIPSRAGQTIEVIAPDHILIHLDFGENRFAQILSSFATPRSKAPALEIHGEQGTVSISQESWYDVDAPVDVWQRDERPEGVEAWTQAAPPGSSAIRHLIQAGPEHFVAVLEGREAPILTAEHAAHVLDIILSAEQSRREGRAIALSEVFGGL